MLNSLLPSILGVLLTMQAPVQPAAPATGQPAPVAEQPAGPAAAEPAPQLPAGNPLDSSPAPRPAFVLKPSVALNDVGIDTNILGSSANPQEDTVGHLSLGAEPSLTAGPVSLSGAGVVGLSYFRQHTDQRSVDTNDTFRLDYRLNRVTLYGADAFVRTRDIFSPELDMRLPRLENTADAGLTLQVTGNTQIGAGVRHARFDFAADVLSTVDLHNSLTRAEDSLIVSLRDAITPLTTIVVTSDVERDRFDFSTFRNANGVRILGGMEFKPTAFIFGKAFVGYRTRTSIDGSYPDAGTVVASLDLGYNPWESVRLGVKVDRDLDHSFFSTERYYIVTGLSGSVTLRLGDAWEVGGTAGRQTLDYGASSLLDPVSGQPVLDATPWSEHLLHFAGTVGYRLGRSAVLRFSPDYIRRDSQQAVRTYDRLRLVSSITVGID